MSISFVVPVYNVEKYLAECLDSLVSQTIDKEIIIINDGSTDGSLAIAEDYFSRYPFITLVNQHNRGLSASRNVGLKMARGKYIYFIDSDDYLIERDFELLLNLAEQHQVDVLNGLRRHYHDNDQSSYVRPPESPHLTQHNQGDLTDGATHLHRMLSRDWAPGVHYSIFRTAFLIENSIDFPEGLTAEDALFTVDVYTTKPDVKVMEVSREFYCYRQRENSITTTLTHAKFFTDIFAICQHLFRRVEKYDNKITQAQTNLDDEQVSKLQQIKLDIIRVIAISYGIAYRYQYLKFSPELQQHVRHYFTPQITQFMQQFLGYEVSL
ncbi:glycosyltransferase [Muribacter muris]|uniref:glycosyltransferase n=1 Tax=Muribacter muris TaxID=67855 RepID=UPI001883320F|nr:glycosyltransferase [Muribacter muris]MBF0784662.1 glycosyltransferase [Muribacter muris]MBF0828136.1 glycosyltransferase [Muribacter muris]